MTDLEKVITAALTQCSFTPGSFDKKFVKQLPNWWTRELTERGRETMIRLLHKYRRQIPEYQDICNELNGQKKINFNG